MPHEEDLRRYEAWKSKLRATIEAARRDQAEARAEWLAEARAEWLAEAEAEGRRNRLVVAEALHPSRN
jgi:hypothetical protein